MTDKQILFSGSLTNWVITIVALILGLGLWDMFPGVAIVIMVGVAVAWIVVRLVHGSYVVTNRLVSTELGLAISGIVIVFMALAH